MPLYVAVLMQLKVMLQWWQVPKLTHVVSNRRFLWTFPLLTVSVVQINHPLSTAVGLTLKTVKAVGLHADLAALRYGLRCVAQVPIVSFARGRGFPSKKK